MSVESSGFDPGSAQRPKDALDPSTPIELSVPAHIFDELQLEQAGAQRPKDALDPSTPIELSVPAHIFDELQREVSLKPKGNHAKEGIEVDAAQKKGRHRKDADPVMGGFHRASNPRHLAGVEAASAQKEMTTVAPAKVESNTGAVKPVDANLLKSKDEIRLGAIRKRIAAAEGGDKWDSHQSETSNIASDRQEKPAARSISEKLREQILNAGDLEEKSKAIARYEDYTGLNFVEDVPKLEPAPEQETGYSVVEKVEQDNDPFKDGKSLIAEDLTDSIFRSDYRRVELPPEDIAKGKELVPYVEKGKELVLFEKAIDGAVREPVVDPTPKGRWARVKRMMAKAKNLGSALTTKAHMNVDRAKEWLSDPEKGKRRKIGILVGAVVLAGAAYLLSKDTGGEAPSIDIAGQTFEPDGKRFELHPTAHVSGTQPGLDIAGQTFEPDGKSFELGPTVNLSDTNNDLTVDINTDRYPSYIANDTLDSILGQNNINPMDGVRLSVDESDGKYILVEYRGKTHVANADGSLLSLAEQKKFNDFQIDVIGNAIRDGRI